ncbi:MAG: MBL fold metallo-hydrolase [Candidatus Tectimicrobiota bacterium]|nr:MAG: MBL fold metallo-hydrolase [Candidatus Tectomicrobia bacterium]
MQGRGWFCAWPALAATLVLGLLVPSLLPAQEPGPCTAGLVEKRGTLVPVAFLPAQATPAVVVEWLGHSSFVLTAPSGLRILTDPPAWHPVPVTPDLVTVSNLHLTHTAVARVPGTPRVLWGLTPEQGWNPVALRLQDVALFNVPSYASRTALEESPIQNSIFVFHLGDLCLVHLGNLRHPLTPQQLRRIGKPDVVMLPVDGQWTLSLGDALTVVVQLQPLLVLPMHIDTADAAEAFVAFTAGRYPVRRLSGRTLVLSRASLPAATELVVFGD